MPDFSVLLGDGGGTRSIGSFSELQGISSSVDVVGVVRLPVTGAVTLRRPAGNDTKMAAWHSSRDRRNGSIVQHDQTGRPTAKWTFTDGWPSKISRVTKAAGFGSRAALPMEEVTLTYSKLLRVK